MAICRRWSCLNLGVCACFELACQQHYLAAVVYLSTNPHSPPLFSIFQHDSTVLKRRCHATFFSLRAQFSWDSCARPLAHESGHFHCHVGQSSGTAHIPCHFGKDDVRAGPPLLGVDADGAQGDGNGFASGPLPLVLPTSPIGVCATCVVG